MTLTISKSLGKIGRANALRLVREYTKGKRKFRNYNISKYNGKIKYDLGSKKIFNDKGILIMGKPFKKGLRGNRSDGVLISNSNLSCNEVFKNLNKALK
jgi:hypothetical protein